MRIMGFSQEWPKLVLDVFTTFRLARRDKDWFVGEQVLVVLHPRSRGRKVLGIAEIIQKEMKTPGAITKKEAIEDGFTSLEGFWEWMAETHGIPSLACRDLNKLTLRWVRRERPCPK